MRSILLYMVFLMISSDLLSQTWTDCCWTKSESGLEYKIENKGKGKKLKSGDSVSIHWVWYDCETGEVLEKSREYNYKPRWAVGSETFVKGFEEGFRKLKRGGSAYIKIPPEIAFGNDGMNGRKTFCYFIEILPN